MSLSLGASSLGQIGRRAEPHKAVWPGQCYEDTWVQEQRGSPCQMGWQGRLGGGDSCLLLPSSPWRLPTACRAFKQQRADVTGAQTQTGCLR